MTEREVIAEVRFIGDVQRITFRQGDRFVLFVPEPVSAEAYRNIQEAWKKFVNGVPDIELAILDNGAKLGLLGIDWGKVGDDKYTSDGVAGDG